MNIQLPFTHISEIKLSFLNRIEVLLGKKLVIIFEAKKITEEVAEFKTEHWIMPLGWTPPTIKDSIH